MGRKFRTLVCGATLALLLAGCTGGEALKEPSDLYAPLSKINPITVSGDPLAENDDSLPGGAPRILAEAVEGSHRILMYANETSCGLLTLSGVDAQNVEIHIVSRRPSENEGSSTHPAGPYNSVSGAGDSNTWASMECSKNAIVVAYVSGEPESEPKVRGHVSTVHDLNRPSTSTFIVGDSNARKEISGQLKS